MHAKFDFLCFNIVQDEFFTQKTKNHKKVIFFVNMIMIF